MDGGGGYTYFDQQTGHEFFSDDRTHLQPLEFEHRLPQWLGLAPRLGRVPVSLEAIQVGAVGYVYAQLTADQGAARTLGANLSRVAAAGPQIAFIFPGKTVQTYLSFKAYWEFAADNRPSGWNGWVTLSFSPSPPEISPAKEAR